MARRMSCALTVDAVLERRKTVTRRHVDTWRSLKPGDRLTLVEKGMGLKKGEKQRVLALVQVVDVRDEPIGRILDEPCGVEREGFPHSSGLWFAGFWLKSHGYKVSEFGPFGSILRTQCRRIEWTYLP